MLTKAACGWDWLFLDASYKGRQTMDWSCLHAHAICNFVCMVLRFTRCVSGVTKKKKHNRCEAFFFLSCDQWNWIRSNLKSCAGEKKIKEKNCFEVMNYFIWALQTHTRQWSHTLWVTSGSRRTAERQKNVSNYSNGGRRVFNFNRKESVEHSWSVSLNDFAHPCRTAWGVRGVREFQEVEIQFFNLFSLSAYLKVEKFSTYLSKVKATFFVLCVCVFL